MKYTWDSRKDRQNVARHGIAFQDAIRILEGPTLEAIDDRFDQGEARIYAIGLVNEIEVAVVNSEPGEGERRIISAWRAERHEREAFWKAIGEASQ
jgi:uncharacterized DUF497 family protein